MWWVLSIKHVCSLPKQVQWNQSLSRSNRINLLSASTDGKILNWAMDGKGQLVLQDGFALVVQQMPRNVKLKASSLCNVIRCWNWVWRSPKAGRLLLPRLKFGNHRSRISSEFYLDNLAASFSVIPMETRLLVHNQSQDACWYLASRKSLHCFFTSCAQICICRSTLVFGLKFRDLIIMSRDIIHLTWDNPTG